VGSFYGVFHHEKVRSKSLCNPRFYSVSMRPEDYDVYCIFCFDFVTNELVPERRLKDRVEKFVEYICDNEDPMDEKRLRDVQSSDSDEDRFCQYCGEAMVDDPARI